MNQKNFIKIILTILIVVIIEIIGYFTINKLASNNKQGTQPSPEQTLPEQQSKSTSTPVNIQPPVKTPSQQEIIPNNYQSIILESNKPNYVKSKGTIKALFSNSATISITIEKVNSPNTEFSDSNALPFIYLQGNTTPKDPSNNYVYGKYGDHYYTFVAPEIPGKYNVVFSEPSREQYEITVVNRVDSELLASKIADRFIFAKLDEANARNWKITSQEIKSIENNWDIVIQINYNSCGIDWESNICTAKVVKGHYLISKSSGIITESNP